MATYYLDYVNGNDSNDGSTWALAWKTITSGATAARIAPGDIIKIAKSPAHYSIGNATWTNLSKTVTLATAQTINVCLCEADWTPVNATNSAKLAVATDAKEGSYCVKITEDASPANGEVQAYFATGALDLSTKQDISFWIKNEVAITAGMLTLNLYTSADATGAAAHTFAIPAIPSTGRWLPLTITSGGNLSNNINSVAIVNGASSTYTASKYIYIDNIIACATGGLNLQSLISKNSAEQGGTEGWYGIQSINGTTVLLDNDTNTKANAGRGYSTTGTTPDTVATYARETIKTALAATNTAAAQEIMDSGTFAEGNIQFQGGYDTGTGNQTGETYFDGLNGYGHGLYLSSKSYTTLNYINFSRYYYGVYYISSSNNTITTLSNANNNATSGVYYTSSINNTITTLSNANNNAASGVYYQSSSNNTITTLSNANNNATSGVYYISSSNNTITTLSNANNNGYGVYYNNSSNNTITTLSNANNNGYGVYYNSSSNNTITTLSTTGNLTCALFNTNGENYILNATIAETTKFFGTEPYGNSRCCVNYLASTGYSYIYTDNGNIQSQAATAGGTGIEWKLSPTNVIRNSAYPLDLDIAKIACAASALVTVKAYVKLSHASDIGAKLVCKGGQIAGVASDVTATASATTDRQELTITFTPSEAGVVNIEVWAYWLANTADENVIVDDLTISQA